MRAAVLLVGTLALAATPLAAAARAQNRDSPALAPPRDPAALVLDATRAALGGSERLAAIETFTATGRTRQIRGDNLLPIEFQIWFAAPDKYLRRDEFPTQDRGPTSTGFDGATIIQDPPQATGAARGRAAPPPGADALKADVARWMLGMFAGLRSVTPVTFTYAAVAEAPQGQADVLEVNSSTSTLGRLFVDRATRLPVMVTWQAGAQESRLYFADYREVSGVKWPFRLRRALGPDPIEETNFDAFRPNARIDARRFEVKR